MVKLPAASSASFVLRFLEMMCRHLQCDNLFSSQPFSHYAAYDRTKSGKNPRPFAGSLFNRRLISGLLVFLVKEEALDTPSLIRGSKRSLTGVSPPYAAPLSPKHLRAEAHPSEGTAFGSPIKILIQQLAGIQNQSVPRVLKRAAAKRRLLP